MAGPGRLLPVASRRSRRQRPDHDWSAQVIKGIGLRYKLNLDIFWLKDEALEESANLPPPDVIAADIVTDLEAALE